MRLSWPRRRAALSAAACALLFVLIAWQLLAHGPLVAADPAVTRWLAARRSDWLTTAMHLVSDLHRFWVVLAACAALAAWLLRRGEGRTARLLLLVPAGMLLNLALKHAFQRARPVLEEPLVFYTDYSFPSGHASTTTLFYGVLCLIAQARARDATTRLAFALLAVTMVALVDFSRVYLGAHHLSDVLAANCLALAWLLALGTPHADRQR